MRRVESRTGQRHLSPKLLACTFVALRLLSGCTRAWASADVPTPACDQIALHGITASYCIYVPKNSAQNPDLLYFFHGATGNAQQWGLSSQAYGAQDLYADWNGGFLEMSRVPPTVISVSFGPFWQLSDWNSDGGPLNLRKLFLEELMPILEAKVGFQHGRRMLAGTSMGGMNALYLWVRTTGVFSKVAALCPALLDASPFSSESDLQAYADATPGATRSSVSAVATILRAIFPLAAGWEGNTLSGYLGSTPASNPLSDSLVVYSDTDEMGLGPATRKFVSLAQNRGLPLQVESRDEDKHCRGFFTSRLADYLVEPNP